MITPQRAAKIVTRAYQLHKAGHIGPALVLYQKVINQMPRHPVALAQAAIATRQLSDLAKATDQPFDKDTARRFMWYAVETATALVAEQGQHADVGLKRDYAAILHNWAKFAHDAGDVTGPAGAKAFYEASVDVDPDLGESWTNLGNVYGELGNRMRAEACWNRALQCRRVTPEARFNLAFLFLLRGDYETGWAEYESRWESVTFKSSYGRPDLSAPRWTGEQTPGTLYLHGEQGAGDIVMMARYIPIVRERVGRLILEVLEPLVPLFEATFPGVPVVVRGTVAPEHDCHLPMMSLPLVFGTTLSNVPPPAPFSVATASIPIEPGRIGVCWKGSATHANDRTRSMSIDAMRPLFRIPGYTWASLQYGEHVHNLEDLPEGDYLETARAIARCELVITVDTSIAHLAGSMGIPTWVLLPYVAEWRWLLDRDDSPWYPSATLWRQSADCDWSDVIRRVSLMLSVRHA